MDERLSELLELEHAGWASLCDGTGGDFYGRTMTDAARMVLAGGTVMVRSDVVASLDHAPPWASYEITDPALMSVSDDVSTLIYTGTGHRDEGESFTAVMASTYLRAESGWRLALYQQTPTA